MSKRINIVLPEATLQAVDRLVQPGERSRFIDTAIRHFVANQSVEALRMRLERTAIRDRDLDREVATDWFAVDHETWRRLDEPSTAEKRPDRSPDWAASILCAKIVQAVLTLLLRATAGYVGAWVAEGPARGLSTGASNG